MDKKTNILVAGAGAWGTALANLLACKGYKTSIWAREIEVVDYINKKHSNEIFLKGFPLDRRLRATQDLAGAAKDCDILISAIPTQYIRSVFKDLKINAEKKILVSLA